MIPLQYIKHSEVEKEAERLLFDFKSELLEKAQPVKTDLLLEFLSDTQDLEFEIALMEATNDEPVAGQYWPNEHRIVINSLYFESNDMVKQRISRFTEGHEMGHALIHRPYYYKDKRQLSLFEDSPSDLEITDDKLITLQRTVESGTFQNPELTEVDIARERQANVFSAALLLPRKPLRRCVKEIFGCDDFVFQKTQSDEYKRTLDTISRRLNDIFDVNPIVMRIRLERLKIVRYEDGAMF